MTGIKNPNRRQYNHHCFWTQSKPNVEATVVGIDVTILTTGTMIYNKESIQYYDD